MKKKSHLPKNRLRQPNWTSSFRGWVWVVCLAPCIETWPFFRFRVFQGGPFNGHHHLLEPPVFRSENEDITSCCKKHQPWLIHVDIHHVISCDKKYMGKKKTKHNKTHRKHNKKHRKPRTNPMISAKKYICCSCQPWGWRWPCFFSAGLGWITLSHQPPEGYIRFPRICVSAN